MKKVMACYRILNILSLDVVAGAVISALFFCAVFDVRPLLQGPLVLGLTVWIIYTADHLLDAYRLQSQAVTQRHAFHQQYFRSLLFTVLLLVVVTIAGVFYIREQVFRMGILLAGMVVFYLVASRYLKFLKEFAGAWLYTSGVLILSLPVTTRSLLLADYLLIIQFFLTAFINLVLFSWFDYASDLQNKHRSIATFFGQRTTAMLLWMLFGLQGLLCIFQFSLGGPGLAVTIIASMNFVLMLLLLFNRWSAQGDRFRLMGDAIFFLPLIYWIWVVAQ